MKNGKWNQNRLRVCRVLDVPLEEVSGICSHRSKKGQMHLIAVGDRLAKTARQRGPNRLAYAQYYWTLWLDASQA